MLTERAMYYPVFRLTPLAGNERSLGYDLGSEPLRRMALETAMRTGLPTATDPITLVQERGSQKGMMVFQPVFDRDDAKRLRGFAVIVLRMGSVLRSAVSDNSVLIELVLQRKDGTSESLANSWQADSPPLTGISLTRPLLAFGKVFSVTAHAGPEFMRLNTLRAGWMATLTGLALTAALSMLISLNLRRREELERLVLERTRELRESKESLQESEAPQRALLDNLPSAVVVVNLETRVIERVNNHVVALFGGTVNSLIGKQCQTIFPVCSNLVNGACFGCDIARSEGDMRKADGMHLTILRTATRIQWQGRTKMLTCFVDVSERKRMEELLRQTHERLSLATRAGGVGIWDYDVINNRLVWDDQMFRHYGINRDRFASNYEAWLAGVHPNDRQFGQEAIQLALRGEKVFNAEFRVLWPDGSTHYLRATAIVERDACGQATHMVGTNWDITAQKQAEELLRERAALLEAQTNASPDGVLVVAQNNKRVLINQRFIEMFDVPEHILDDDDQTPLLNHIANLAKYPSYFLRKFTISIRTAMRSAGMRSNSRAEWLWIGIHRLFWASMGRITEESGDFTT